MAATIDSASPPCQSFDEDDLFGLERYTQEEKAHIDLLKTLQSLKAPLKTFDQILAWVSRAKATGYTFNSAQPSREKVLKKLYERHNLSELKPKEKKLLLPYSKRVVNIVYFDAKAVFKSLLSCPILNTVENLLFEDDNPFTPPRQRPSSVSEITSGRAYRKTYATLVENSRNEILFPCVLAIDKTQCDRNARLPMEPLTISHGLVKHKIRRMPVATRILGYINHTPDEDTLGCYDLASPVNEEVSPDNEISTMPHLNLDTSLMTKECITMNDYHAQLEFILIESGFLLLQESSGVRWTLKYKGVSHQNVTLCLYVPFIIGDTEGHDYLCGHYGSRGQGVAQLCRACECPNTLTNDENVTIKYRRPAVIETLTERKCMHMLKENSQHFVLNAFRLVQFGTHNNRGIFGACPGEMLHLVQLGWFKYAMQAFVSQVGKKSIEMSKFDSLCSIVGNLLHRQSDRNIPKTRLPKGFVGGAHIPGHEMTGCLYVMLFALHTSRYRDIFSEKARHRSESGLGNKAHITDWINLLSSLLQWQEWLKQEEIPVHIVSKSTKSVKWLMQMMKSVAPREEGMGYNTIKFHLPLHLADDILNHGVPQNVNSAFAESAHIPIAKHTTRNTQKRKATFTIQAANRYVENLAVGMSWRDANLTNDSPIVTNNHTTAHSRKDGKHFTATETLTGDGIARVVCYWGKKTPSNHSAGRTVRVMETAPHTAKNKARVKLNTEVYLMLHEILMQVQSDSLPCSTEYQKNHGNEAAPVTYRAHPEFYGEQWNDFVTIKWSGENEPLPARIHTFVDLRGVIPPTQTINIRQTATQPHLGPARYAIIESFTPCEDNDNYSNTIVGRFRRDKHKDGRRKLYLADVESFVEPIVGIPDVHSGISEMNRQDRVQLSTKRPRQTPCGRPSGQQSRSNSVDEHCYIFMIRSRDKWAECWNSIILDQSNNEEDEATPSE